MDYSMIGKIEKAKRYAQERNRFEFHAFSVTVKGDNNSHVVSYDKGKWHSRLRVFPNPRTLRAHHVTGKHPRWHDHTRASGAQLISCF